MTMSRRYGHAAGLIGALLLAPCVAQAQSSNMYDSEEHPSALAMTGDLLIARPVGLVTTVAIGWWWRHALWHRSAAANAA